MLVVNKHTASDYTEKQGSSTKMAAEIGKQVFIEILTFSQPAVNTGLTAKVRGNKK